MMAIDIKAVWRQVCSYQSRLAEPLFVGRDGRRPVARLANHPVRDEPCPAIFVRLLRPTQLRDQIYSGFVLAIEEGTFSAAADTDLFAQIRCADPSFRDLFLEFSQNLMRKLEGGMAPDPAIQEAIAEWLCFFKRTGLKPLKAEKLTGLYGELSLLAELLRATPGATSLVRAWRGPLGEAWDFNLSEAGRDILIEVKSTVRPRTEIAVHGLDQLRPSCHMQSYLNFRMFDVVEVSEDAAQGTIACLRQQIEQSLRGAGLVTEFFERLELAGYFPHHEAHYRRTVFQQQASRWHKVDADFPSLHRHSLPPALRDRISNVKYVLNVADLPEVEFSPAEPGQKAGFPSGPPAG